LARSGTSDMLDIGWSELALIAVVALMVIGPKDLPRALYTLGKWTRAARKVTREFQKHVDDMMREADLEDVRKNLKQVQAVNVKKQIQDTIDPKGEIKSALDPTENSDTIAKPKGSAKATEPTAAVEPPRSGITAEVEGRDAVDGRRASTTAEAAPAEKTS
ncbi:MAG TPA: Sec-independent protein translocase protein TatB, partial [Alphaproteobacteria bacterium]|nr:Sec-independent protein translocase protein TatB [Alphaproteobacteria bacterium]